MNYFPIRSWYDWSKVKPINPLDLVVNAQLVMGPNTDQGIFVNSSTYATPPAPPNLLKIIGGRVIDPSVPRILASLQNPISTLVVGASDNPKRFEIDFTSAPDVGTVTTSSFLVTGSTVGHVGSGTISFPSSATARLDFPSSLVVDSYAIQLNGTTSPQITLSTVPLDGEAIALPSGDGVPGGNFLFGINVISGSVAIPPPAPPLSPLSIWKPSQIYIAGLPLCVALGSDNLEKTAEAIQWIFSHLTANTNAYLSPSLANQLFLRGGTEWRMDIPLNVGYLGYTELLISILENAGTRGDDQGTIPGILFNSRTYLGLVTLRITFKRFGKYNIGIRGIDTNGYYSMFNSSWNIVP